MNVFWICGHAKTEYRKREGTGVFLNVLEYWVRKVQVDGYRFDVIDEIDENFVLKIRDRLKRLNPELILIGETWAEGKRLLNGCEMDSIMNYSFRQAMLDFLQNGVLTPKHLAIGWKLHCRDILMKLIWLCLMHWTHMIPSVLSTVVVIG